MARYSFSGNLGIKAGFVELTIPDKPSSGLQKYRLTEAGRAFLASMDS
jgi:hypothetical protein